MIIITFGSEPPPPLKSDNQLFWQLDLFLVLDTQNVRHITQNAGHSAQNDGTPCKMLAAPCIMSAATNLMFAKDQRGGSGAPQGPPTPILEKSLVSRNDL